MDLTALINSLDIHSGTITAIATIALMFATVFLVRATSRLANITKNQDKPWLHFYYNPKHENLYVKNVGKGAAFDVQFKIESKTESYPQNFDAISPNDVVLILGGVPMEIGKNWIDDYQINGLTYKDINGIPTNQNKKIKPRILHLYP